jgi:P pilus assembly chaperone PapD
LNQVHSNPLLPGGQTHIDTLKQIVAANITTQIKANGLVQPFQGGIAPFGPYTIGLLEDNCECYAALKVFGEMLRDMGDSTAASYGLAAVLLGSNIHGVLYNVYINAWLWNDAMVVDTFTFSPLSNTATAMGAGTNQYPSGQQVIFGAVGALPAGLDPNTNYWIVNSTGRTFQLARDLGGPPIVLGTAGTGTQYGFLTGSAWYPDLLAPCWPEYWQVASSAYQAGTLSIAGNQLTRTTGTAWTSADVGLVIELTGYGSYYILSVESGSSATALGPPATAAGVAYTLWLQTGGAGGSIVADGIRYSFAWNQLCKLAPNWWEGRDYNVFPDMQMAWFAAVRRQDVAKAASMFDRMARYYLAAGASPGMLFILEACQAQAVQDALATPFVTSSQVSYPDTDLQVRSLSAAQRYAPPSFVQTVTGVEVITVDAETKLIQAAAAVTMTSTPTLGGGAEGQVLLLTNAGTYQITLQDNSLLSGSGLSLSGKTVILAQWSTVQLTYIQGGWRQTTVPVATGGAVAPSLAVTITGPSFTIPSSNAAAALATAAAVAMTSTPTIAAGADGQTLTLVNVSPYNITLQSYGALAGSGLLLATDTVVLPPWGTVSLLWLAAAGMWVQVGLPNVNYLQAALALVSGVLTAGGLNLNNSDPLSGYLVTDGSRNIHALSAASFLTALSVYTEAQVNAAIAAAVAVETNRAIGVENSLSAAIATKAGLGVATSSAGSPAHTHTQN